MYGYLKKDVLEPIEQAQEASSRTVLVDVHIIASSKMNPLPSIQGRSDTTVGAFGGLRFLLQIVIARFVVWREVGDATHEGARNCRQVAASHDLRSNALCGESTSALVFLSGSERLRTPV